MPLSISDSGNGATYAFTEADAKGNPEASDVGTATWTVSDPALLTVVPAADGFSAVVNAAGPVGTATVSVSVDVTDANGTEVPGSPFTASDDVTVVAGPVSQIALTGTVNP